MADLEGATRAAIWDGRRSPFRPGSIALVVCDDRAGGCAEALAPALAEGGTQVTIVRSTRRCRFALFPTPEQLRAVIGHRWPITYDGSPRRWLGYWLATTPIWGFMGRAGLDLPWPADSVVQAVLDHVSAAVGGRAELRGLIVGRGLGQLTLRVRCAGQELAVRVAASPDSARRLGNHQCAMAGLSARLGSQNAVAFPVAVASGSAAGISWTAEGWLSSPAVRASRAWRRSGSGWGELRAIAAELAAAAQTGRTGAGGPRLDDRSGRRRARPCRADRRRLGADRGRRDGHGMVSWRSVARKRHSPQATPASGGHRLGTSQAQRPAGLDAVYVEVCRVVMARRCAFGEATARPGSISVTSNWPPRRSAGGPSVTGSGHSNRLLAPRDSHPLRDRRERGRAN